MKGMLLKNSVREIKGSFGRFFAIFAIVAIGVAFFAGLVATSPDMRYTTDKYYDEYNLMDLRLLSTFGFDEDDVKAIRSVEGVDGLFATYNMDVVTKEDGVQSTIRIMGLPDSDISDDNKEYINRLRIKEGRLPKKRGECVVKYKENDAEPYKIGDKIVVESGTDADIEDSLESTTYEIVGIVYTPYYVNFDIGESEIGSGSVDYCMMILNEEFKSEYYTELFATVEGARALDTYKQEYFDKVGEVADRIEGLVDERIDIRLEKLNKDIDKEREDAIKLAHETIKDKVWEKYDSLVAMYSTMYPGQDVVSMVVKSLEEAEDEAVKNFDTAEIDEEINKARKELNDTAADWEWYVLDRDSHYSYRDYESTTEMMETIASVFPIFFMLIAALVCLTTMTRMVEEQRELIGTFKALGYKKSSIAMKYILYSLIASLSGGVIGCAIGLKIFPAIIYYCWGIMYDLPDLSYTTHIGLSFVAIGLMVLVIEVSTIAACYRELMEVPSILMRPKAPRKGKKILLERIGFIWKRLSFSNKVTARNIFRYKKRFFMTVVGVAGGCALMMTGYGIKDSISVLIQKQFGEIQRYDVSVSFDDDSIGSRLRLDSDVKTALSLMNYTADVSDKKEMVDDDTINLVSVNVIKDADRIGDFVTFRKRNTDITYSLDDSGVLISEKTAKDLGVKAGDTFYIQDADEDVKEVTVSHVIEMYTGHHIYMTAKYYEDVFDKKVTDNYALVMLNSADSDTETRMGIKYLDMDGVKGVTLYSGSEENFNDMISTLNLVTYILIISAAALSFVVLYNLTNVNVSERIREIATIKVLGFYNNEVSAYVYRENIVISVIGAAVGLGLGVVLHHFIMVTLEFDDMMYGNVIRPVSFLISFMLTMLFSVLVNIFMQGKLKKIKMVESLKSVE